MFVITYFCVANSCMYLLEDSISSSSSFASFVPDDVSFVHFVSYLFSLTLFILTLLSYYNDYILLSFSVVSDCGCP